MQNVSVVETVALENLDFVPSAVYLGGRKAELVWRSQLGPVTLVGAKREGSFLRVQTSSGAVFKCKAETFGGSDFPSEFLDSIAHAVRGGYSVELCVAAKLGGRAAPEYFCGLRLPVSRDLTGLLDL